MKLYILSFLLALFLIDVVSSLNKSQDCKCRIQKRQSRIIGGREANSIFPWVVSLQSKEWIKMPTAEESKVVNLHFCGGVIISERWIITAAHCVDDDWKDKFHVAYGGHDLVMIYERNQYAKVEAVYRYPNYVPDDHTPINDIALVRLAQLLNFSETVQPACLPARHQENYNGVLTITGFGRLTHWTEGDPPKLSRYMSEGNTYDVSQDPRATTHNGLRCRITTEVCVGNRLGEWASSPCNADSGGPLHQKERGRTTVIGLFSYFDEIREAGLTINCVGVSSYTRISAFIDWIQKTVGNEICV